LVVRNGGRSPAINTRWYLTFMIGPTKDARRLDGEIPKATVCDKELFGKGTGSVILPNGEATLPVGIPQQVAARLDDVYSAPPKVGLFVVGCLDYTDTSQKPRYRTNFTLAVEPSAESAGGIAILDAGNNAY
jgi:hypothetical protein